ncbi:MAG: hypothetical protein WCG75_06105 [Armatimonadota bacterium]
MDLGQVPVLVSHPVSAPNPKPDQGNLELPSSKTIPGQPQVEIENLKADDKKAIQAEVEKETDNAIQIISKRLHGYYSREIDDFYKVEFSKLGPYKQGLTERYLLEIRTIFEATAKKRGPILTRLTFMTKFPPNVNIVPFDEKSLSPFEVKRQTEIQNLKRSLVALDHQYDQDIIDLEKKNASKLEAESERILATIAARQKQIDIRAADEATKLVRRFSSGISDRIFSRYTFQLKELPTKTVNFPKMPAQVAVPRVTFERNLQNRDDRADLTKELEAFLSLNHYSRVTDARGAKDVTKEFIEWRTNLKSGHWESWQKSSAQK